MITIVDYGLGNILAFANVYKRLNIDIAFAKCAEDLVGATKIILPGVGAFDHAMERLERSGMRQRLDELVLDEKVPVLGICVGMQILASSSDEGQLPGLSWIDGRVKGFKSASQVEQLACPHMGWNDVTPVQGNRLFKDLEQDAKFYFLHSYYIDCNINDDIAATTHYGFNFACAVQHRNIYGVQFHPEKSHHYGQQLLKNFGEI